MVIGSLPSTSFSVLNDGLTCHRIDDPESQRRKMAEATEKILLIRAPSTLVIMET